MPFETVLAAGTPTVDRRSGAGIGSDVGTSLFFRHPHTQKNTRLLIRGTQPVLVVSGNDQRFPDLSKLGLMSQAHNRRRSHRSRTSMTHLDLRDQPHQSVTSDVCPVARGLFIAHAMNTGLNSHIQD